jgi:predicted DNA-binding protein (UPF0251 family)/predicted Fe-Mo cluster-binding NifX family protein
MPRPCCLRRISAEIRARSIVSLGEDAQLVQELLAGAERIVLRPDEVEALRLADLEGRYQEEAACMMGISRQTFGRILERAHKKVADAIVNGRALTIERAKAPCLERPPFAERSDVAADLRDGGSSGEQKQTQDASASLPLQEKTMKIAFISDDGKTISQHFGRAAYYVVLTIEDGKVVQRDQLPKLGHGHFAGQHEEHHGHGSSAGHGFEAGAHERHASMVAPILDCEALIAGGMGAGAYASIQSAGIEPIVTDMQLIDEAAAAYIAGTLKNHPEYLH